MKIPLLFSYWTDALLLLGVLLSIFSVGVVTSGKILANAPHVELDDYRLGSTRGLGDPYVILYERENYKGRVHYHRLAKKGCTNVAASHANWASSIDLQRHCVKLCDGVDCGGRCVMAVEDQAPRAARGVGQLAKIGLNDAVKSVKFCFS